MIWSDNILEEPHIYNCFIHIQVSRPLNRELASMDAIQASQRGTCGSFHAQEVQLFLAVCTTGRLSQEWMGRAAN